jgi:hypothetical protein
MTFMQCALCAWHTHMHRDKHTTAQASTVTIADALTTIFHTHTARLPEIYSLHHDTSTSGLSSVSYHVNYSQTTTKNRDVQLFMQSAVH